MTPIARSEIKWTAAMLLVGFLLSFAVVKIYRANGREPRFYQENFGPAVMMTCGYGFTAPPFGSSPPSLFKFLHREVNTFACSDLPTPMPTEVVSWNGTWYYLYSTTSLVWRVTGISWTALDGLAATFGAFTLAALYGLFRLVSTRRIATAAALIVMLTPAHLDQLPMLRDYSKGPFVLLSVLTLAWLVMRPLSVRATIMLALVFGSIVGLGYGFRSDLVVMVPFGVAIILFFLPGSLREHWHRNVAAAVAAALAFVVIGYPPLKGQQTGGCQFHYSLLGLTTPLVNSMNLESPIYAFGDHFLDTFVDLKVGDYANRVMAQPVPNLCAPEYDLASADMFFKIVRTFPADLVVHAYGSVVTILKAGLAAPHIERLVGGIPLAASVASRLDQVLAWFSWLGPVVAVAAIAVASGSSPRLGLALTAFVLFLCGYPAIEFESRHWFHLRFIPLWALLVVIGAWMDQGRVAFGPAARRGAITVIAIVAVLAAALAVIRLYQRGPAETLIASYLSAPVEAVTFTAADDSTRTIDWRPLDYGPTPGHRSSDMLVVTVAARGCGEGDVPVRFKYETDGLGHDISSTVAVHRDRNGSAPTRVFFPVFSQGHLDHTYLRFSAIDTLGRSADCIQAVERFADRGALPLWIQAQAPPDWRDRPLYQSFVVPHFLRQTE